MARGPNRSAEQCLIIKSCIEALNSDWEPLENERYFVAVTSYYYFIIIITI